MACDEVVIGSGLSALGTALGLLDAGRQVLCITGNPSAETRMYPGAPVPLEHAGPGGLGCYWHGVIPLACSTGFPELRLATFCKLLAHFYPELPGELVGQDLLFVPYRPIRPFDHLRRLGSSPDLTLRSGLVETMTLSGSSITCQLSDGGRLSARRVWLCCGALETPRLLARSAIIKDEMKSVSDHIIGYAGLVAKEKIGDHLRRPVRRFSGGIALPCSYSDDRKSLYMLRPAHFDFARLDAGIEKRTLFGLPTSRLLAGLLGKFSPGLVAEALYNKFGLLRSAQQYSVNFITSAATVVASRLREDVQAADTQAARRSLRRAIDDVPVSGLVRTRRPELYIPGIHLHGSLSPEASTRFTAPASPIRIVDASIYHDIGPEHHSFKMLAAAYQTASSS